jgi:hypothetical protein
MRLLSIQDAERSSDIDIRMVAGRASRFRVFGSTERIPDSQLAVVDLRDSPEPSDFDRRFRIVDRHPMLSVMLVRKISE